MKHCRWWIYYIWRWPQHLWPHRYTSKHTSVHSFCECVCWRQRKILKVEGQACQPRGPREGIREKKSQEGPEEGGWNKRRRERWTPGPPAQPARWETLVLERSQLSGVPAQTHGSNRGHGWSHREMTVCVWTWTWMRILHPGRESAGSTSHLTLSQRETVFCFSSLLMC